MNELYNRDKNHPSVIAWSVANEPSSELPEAVPYFKYVSQIEHLRLLILPLMINIFREVFDTIRVLDHTRPKTFTTFKTLDVDLCVRVYCLFFGLILFIFTLPNN